MTQMYDGRNYPDSDPLAPEAASRSGPSVHDIAAVVLRDHAFVETAAGTVFRYNGAWWEACTKETLAALIWRADTSVTSLRKRGEVAAFIRAARHAEALEWNRVSDSEVAVANGVFDVNRGALRAHRAEDYLENVTPHDFDPALWPADGDPEGFDYGRACPMWRDALDVWFGDEVDKWNALQDFFGYVTLPRAMFKKALLVIGKTNTGKSQIVGALEQLVGREFRCSLAVEHMGDPVMHDAIVGKKLNVITELDEDSMVRDTGFKAFVSTGDPILVNPKYAHPFTYTPGAKHVIAGNDPPRFTEKSAPTLGRLLVVPMGLPVPPEARFEDFQARIKAEMPGILAWALLGARRLLANGGRFTDCQAGLEEIERARHEANPMIDFVLQRMHYFEDSRTTLSTLKDRFNEWNGSRLQIKRIGKMARGAADAIESATGHGFKIDRAKVGGGAENKRTAVCVMHWAMSHDLDN